MCANRETVSSQYHSLSNGAIHIALRKKEITGRVFTSSVVGTRDMASFPCRHDSVRVL